MALATTAGPTVVVCDWAAQAFLCAESGGKGRTCWCFLSELVASGVPSKVADFVRDATCSALETLVEADAQLRNGHLGIHKEMCDASLAIAAQRTLLMDRFVGGTSRCRALREAFRAEQEQRTGACAAAIEPLARRVASALQRDHHAILDDFLPAPLGAACCVSAVCLGSAVAALYGSGMQPWRRLRPREGHPRHERPPQRIEAEVTVKVASQFSSPKESPKESPKPSPKQSPKQSPKESP